MRRALTGWAAQAGAWVAGLTILAACAERSGASSFPMEIEARDDSGRPVGAVEARVGKAVLGRTGADGRLSASLVGRDGQRETIRLAPPPTHRLLSPPEVVLLLQWATPLGGDRAEPQPVRLAVRLAPQRRRYAILALTDGRSDLALRVGEDLTESTDAWGIAQALHVGEPGRRLVVRLETRTQPHLRPVNPTRIFDLPDRDQVLVFEQDFRVERPPKRRHRAKRKRSRIRRLSERQ